MPTALAPPVREPQGTHTTSRVTLSKACAKAAPQTHALDAASKAAFGSLQTHEAPDEPAAHAEHVMRSGRGGDAESLPFE